MLVPSCNPSCNDSRSNNCPHVESDDIIYNFEYKCRGCISEHHDINSKKECIISHKLLKHFEKTRRLEGLNTDGTFITIVVCQKCMEIVPTNIYHEDYLWYDRRDEKLCNKCSVCDEELFKCHIVV